MDSMRKLEEIFAHFPGIGPRQARRFVYYLLNKPAGSVREFTDLIHEVKKATTECQSCHRFFMVKNESQSKNGKGAVCNICSDPHRDQTELMVVARDSDFESVEKSGAYKGLYFILGGTVPILEKEADKRIRIKMLLERLATAGSALKEIILSMNTTPEGENTATVVTEYIQALPVGKTLKITVLGRGLSTGAELEYVDGDTIKSALENRH